MYNRKALSPVVATVVLIAAAIVVGTIATVWTSGFVAQRTTESGSTSCAIQTGYSLENIVYNSTTGAYAMKLTNIGVERVNNFSVDMELTNGSIFSNNGTSTTPTAATEIAPGQSVLVSGFVTNATGLSLRSFKVRNSKCPNFFVTSTSFTTSS